MRIDIKPAGGDRYRRALAGLSSGEIAQATAEAINMGAARARNAMREEMQSVFDRPTSYILRSVQVVTGASAANPNATIAPTYMGGKGIDPQQILAAQEAGGRRHDKRRRCRCVGLASCRTDIKRRSRKHLFAVAMTGTGISRAYSSPNCFPISLPSPNRASGET